MSVINALVKWIAQLAISLSAGLLAIIFLSGNPQVSAFMLRITLLVAVAVLSTFSARVFFNRTSPLLALSTTLLASFTAVVIIDQFYRSAYRLSFLSDPFRLSPPKIGDISQVILLLLVSLPGILLFRRPKKIPTRSTRSGINLKVFFQSIYSNIQQAMNTLNPLNWSVWKKFKKQKKVNIRKPVRKSIAPKVTIPTRSVTTTNKVPTAVHVNKSTNNTRTKKMKLPGRLFQPQNHDVKLIGEEEHVCPYCLEEVHRQDARGVKICQECGTWHHQDCWDLTGACGVAHRNEL